MQVLYEWDFRGGSLTDLEMEKSLVRDAEEFAPGVHDLAFMRKLLFGVIEKLFVWDGFSGGLRKISARYVGSIEKRLHQNQYHKGRNQHGPGR